MFEFVLVVVLANAMMLACLYFLRHVIAIKAPVLFMAVGISTFYCILYPFVVARIPYPKILFLYIILIIIGAAVLYFIETRFFLRCDGGESLAGMAATEALAVVEPKRPLLAVRKEFADRMAAVDFTRLLQFYRIGGQKGSVDESSGPGGPVKESVRESGVSCHQHLEMPDEPGIDLPAAAMESVTDDVASLADLEAAPALEEKNQKTEEGPIQQCGEDIGILVARAFDRLEYGDSVGAVGDFFKALRLEPPPKLAVMLCVEIVSVYLAQGHKRQALAALEMLEAVWGQALSAEDLAEIKVKINKLRGEV